MLNLRPSKTLILTPIQCFFSTAINPSSFSPSKFRALLSDAETGNPTHIEEEDGQGTKGTVTMTTLVDKIEDLNVHTHNRSNRESRDSEHKRKGVNLDCYVRELGDWRNKILEHKQILLQLAKSETHLDFQKWMIKLQTFNDRNFRFPFGNSDVQKMVNSLNSSSKIGHQETLILLHKIDQAMRVLQCQSTQKNKHSMQGLFNTDHQVGEFSEINRGRDGVLLQKFRDIETKHQTNLNRKEDYTQVQKTIILAIPPPKLRAFDVDFIDVYRTTKVINGMDSTIYNVWLACGNYNGVIGFSKAESSSGLQNAVQKSYDKCSQNLYYIEHRTITKPVQSEYEGTRVFLWPAPLGKGIKGFKLVRTVLSLAGFKDVRSKVFGWKNPQNTIRALLIALNASEMIDNENDTIKYRIYKNEDQK